MAATAARVGDSGGSPPFTLNIATIIQIILVLLVDGFGLLLAWNIWQDGNAFFAIAIALTLALITLIVFVPALWPLKWISPALGLMILLSIYPLLYTVYIAFTNYSDGHRYTKVEAVELLGERRFVPEGGAAYASTIYTDGADGYALWLTDDAGESFFATSAGTWTPVEGEPPETYESYTQLDRGAMLRALGAVDGITFGDAANGVQVRSMTEAAGFQQQWTYDAATDSVTDNATGTVYTADMTRGEFVSAAGETSPIGFWVGVGFDNFAEIISSSISQGPLIRVVLWTIAFAVLGTLSGFALGLFTALMLNGSNPALRILRTVLIIPYAVPGLVSVLVWRGMLNGNIGVIPNTLNSVFGWSPPFGSDPGWAKVAILIVNMWFAAPYFMLIASGALQSISSSVYEAAEVDGADKWTQFWQITLPLVLVALGPLLIASIIFNFNNFFLMEAMFGGGPPIAGTTAPPVGHTDNLISYTYRMAFSAGGQKDYGLASSLGVIIFMIVGLLTLLQFRLTRSWEQVSENV